MAFDSYGNIFVVDTIKRNSFGLFMFINLLEEIFSKNLGTQLCRPKAEVSLFGPRRTAAVFDTHFGNS